MDPKLYSKELFAKICARIAEGEYLLAICRSPGMPAARTVRSWVMDNHDGCAAEYARARHLGADVLAEALLEIADNVQIGTKTVDKPLGIETHTGDMTEHRKLKIDARKWLLAKWHPEKYGERKAVDLTVSEDTEARKRLIEARERTGK